MLPIGTRTLREIDDQTNPADRVRDAGSLLEFALVAIAPNLTDDSGSTKVDLGARVRHHDKLFSNPKDVSWAIGIRNDLTHHDSGRPKPFPDEVERAGNHLLSAIRELLPVLPREVLRDMTAAAAPGTTATASPPMPSADTPADGSRWTPSRTSPFARIALFAAVCGLVLFGLLKLSALMPESAAATQARLDRIKVKQVEIALKEKENATRAGIRTLLDRAKQAEHAATGLLAELARYEKDVLPLMESDVGKQIATDASSVETLVALLAKPRPSRDEAERLLVRIREDQVAPRSRGARRGLL